MPSRMQYSTMHQAYANEISQVEKSIQAGAGATQLLINKNPTWDITRFSIAVFGIRPYKYQHLLSKHFFNSKRMIVCKSRQIGISTWAQIAALYCVAYNKFPSGIFNNTKIGIISKSDDQSKKVLLDIKKLMSLGDHLLPHKPFEKMIDASKHIPQTMKHISFKNKCTIKCFPPTDGVRGETFDIVFIDEAAFIDNEDIFYNSIVPTVSKTDGKIIIMSTPNGQRGFFFESFDPNDTRKTHEYDRYWLYWKHCEDPVQRKVIKQYYEEATQTGNRKKFEQEYEALFTVDEQAFFESADVDKNIDENLSLEYNWTKSPCSVSIDYGQTRSATVITVKTKYEGKIITLFQWADFNFDENLLMDISFEHSIPNLYNRYDVRWIVVDDCSQGYRTNKELENKGYPVLRYSWGRGQHTGDKNRMYYHYRSLHKRGIIRYPHIRELIHEMKAMMEVRMKISTAIQKPNSGTDDRIDGEVMATIPFMEEDNDFKSDVITPQEDLSVKRYGASWHDHEWDYLQATLPSPQSLLKNIRR